MYRQMKGGIAYASISSCIDIKTALSRARSFVDPLHDSDYPEDAAMNHEHERAGELYQHAVSIGQ